MQSFQFHYPYPFPLESGESLPCLDIQYHLSQAGTHAPIIWICHALTANSNPQEWWDTLVGPGKFFDTQKMGIVCANMLGSCYGTTGPQSINPATGQPYGWDFPLVSIRDMVRAHEILREYLGIQTIDLLIGGSSGGFQALEWSLVAPSRIRALCPIATAPRISPWATALNEAQRMAIEADYGPKGLAAARAMALTSYRSFEGYGRTQAEPEADCFQAGRAASYQRHQGRKLVDRFDACSYYRLTQGLDTHNVGRGRGGVASALAHLSARTLCIGIDSDGLFPLSEVQAMADAIPGAHLQTISSAYGHDGFLLEYQQIITSLCKFLNLEAVR